MSKDEIIRLRQNVNCENGSKLMNGRRLNPNQFWVIRASSWFVYPRFFSSDSFFWFFLLMLSSFFFLHLVSMSCLFIVITSVHGYTRNEYLIYPRLLKLAFDFSWNRSKVWYLLLFLCSSNPFLARPWIWFSSHLLDLPHFWICHILAFLSTFSSSYLFPISYIQFPLYLSHSCPLPLT